LKVKKYKVGWADFRFCCGMFEVGNFDSEKSVDELVEDIKDCIKMAERVHWKPPNNTTLGAIATTVPKQVNAIEALSLCGFYKMGESRGMHGADYMISVWFRPADVVNK
jgi:hypothetical protein